LIQKENAIVGQRHLARQRHLSAADQPHIGDGVVRGPEWAGRDEGGAPPVRPATV
jgi:hypothetical protein